MQFCPLPSSTILTVIIKTAVSWVSVTSFDNRLFNALDPEGCVTPYNSSKSDLRFQRALRVAEHHPNRNWNKLRPDRPAPARAGRTGIQERTDNISRSSSAFTHLSRDPPRLLRPGPHRVSDRHPRTQRAWHRERAAAGRAPAMPPVPVRWRRPPGRAMFR